MEADDTGIVKVDDGVIRSPGLDFIEACEFFWGEFDSVDDGPNSTHSLSFQMLFLNPFDDFDSH